MTGNEETSSVLIGLFDEFVEWSRVTNCFWNWIYKIGIYKPYFLFLKNTIKQFENLPTN